jgi:hypothetical protein
MLGPHEPGPPDAHRLLQTDGLRRALDLALAAADRLGHGKVGTGHLLLGLLEEPEGVACRLLCKLGIGRLGKNLSAVAKYVCKEMKGARRRKRREEGPVSIPGLFPKPRRERPSPEHVAALLAESETAAAPAGRSRSKTPTRPSGEDLVIMSLSVALMVVVWATGLRTGGDLVDRALFSLGAVGCYLGLAFRALGVRR